MDAGADQVEGTTGTPRKKPFDQRFDPGATNSARQPLHTVHQFGGGDRGDATSSA